MTPSDVSLPEMPPAHDRNTAFGASYAVFTADQLRSYALAAVMAERERCAKVAERTPDGWDGHESTGIAADISAAIRKGD